MELIEGLDDAVQAEYDRLRAILRDAITNSPYTIGQVAALANVGERTLYSILAGKNVGQMDTIIRVLFAVGARFEVGALPQEEADSLQLAPLATTSDTTGSRSQGSSSSRSTSGSARGGAIKAQKTDDLAAKRVVEQRKKAARKKRSNRR